MSTGNNTDKGCEDMDCWRHTGMKAVEEENMRDKSSFETVEPKDGILSSESEERTDHFKKSSDINDDYAVHGGDLDMPDSSLVETEDSSPVQCTEDMPHKAIEQNSSRPDSERFLQSQVVAFVDDVDLPHNTSETELSENSSHHDKAPRLLCVDDPCGEQPVNKEELKLMYSTEKDTSRKLAVSDQANDSTEASPLDIKQFLKPVIVQHQEVCVNMFHCYSTQVSSPIMNKMSGDVTSTPDQYRSEMYRLGTYVDYPSDQKVFVIRLAANGFIYLPVEQSVQCCFCNLKIYLSELNGPGADPERMHFNRCPHCPLKQGGESCGNVPVMALPIGENGPMPTKPDHVSSSGMKSESVLNTTGGSIGGGEERPAGSMYGLDAAFVRHSPVIQRPPGNVMVTDSAPDVEDSPSLPIGSDHMLQQGDLPSAAASLPVNSNQPNTAGSRNKNKTGSSSSMQTGVSHVGSEQNDGASASASASSSKASKSSKKSKTAKKAEAAASRKTPSSSGTAASANGSASAPNASGNKSNASPSSDKGEQGKKKKLTYADLGIFADKPKRPDMASLSKRLGTFEGKWKSSYAKTNEELGECGMYYAGYADCARCFFCGGGLKNWEAQDEPWVEHARWFPKCAYLQLCKGPVFVDTIQRKNRNNEKITMKDVEEEVKQKTRKTEPSVPILPASSSNAVQGSKSQVSSVRELEAENEELNSQMACKICMDEQSSVVFLPCGHMVACTDCAVVLKSCPLCRSDIRGTVKAQMEM